MKSYKSLYPLLVFGFALSPLWGSVEKESPKKVFQIPVQVKGGYFVPKPPEVVPDKLPLKEGVGINPKKVGLLYPKEIFIPREKIEERGGFASCGQPDDRSLYAKAVEEFQRGNLREAEADFLKLLYRYPESPFSLKAKYYLGVIAFLKGDYEKAYKIFKGLCQSHYNCAWKRFACYNAFIASLYLGKPDAEAARSNPFWEHYLRWLEGKEDDLTLLGKIDCFSLEVPYKNYCYYLREFLTLTPSGKVLPDYYKRSVELRKALLSLLGGEKPNIRNPEEFIKNPHYGADFEYFYTYYLIEEGEYSKALGYLRDLKRKNPKLAATLASLLIAKAPEYAPELLKLFKDRKLWRVYLTTLYNRGNYGAVYQYGREKGFYRLAAYAAYRLHLYGEAAKLLAEVKQRGKTDERLLLDSLLLSKNWGELQAELQKVKDIYPDLYKEYLGWLYYYKGEWSKALPFLKSHLYRAVAYYNMGAYGKVLKELKNENIPLALLLKARALLAQGRFEEAARLLKGVHTAEAYYIRGIAFFADGKYREAVEEFKRVLPYREKYPDVVLRLADAYFNLHDYAEAKRYYLLYLKENPKGNGLIDAYIGLVNLYLATGDPSVADYVYAAIERFPKLVGDGVKLKLAEAFLRNGETEKAQKLLKELLNSKENYVRSEAYLLMAELNPNLKEAFLKKALSEGTPEVKSRAAVMLAEYYLSRGEKQKAKKLLEEYGGYITDMETAVKLYARLGEFDKAYNLLAELISADNRYTALAFEMAQKYGRPKFYELSAYSLDPKIAAQSLYNLERLELKRHNLKGALKYALLLKVRNLKVEPTYTRAMFEIIKALYRNGFISDACKLVGEVNPTYLSPAEKTEWENIKFHCSTKGGKQ